MFDVKKGPVLVVMAAGMGSRFGGLKQIADVDGRGHALIDYAVYESTEEPQNKRKKYLIQSREVLPLNG